MSEHKEYEIPLDVLAALAAVPPGCWDDLFEDIKAFLSIAIMTAAAAGVSDLPVFIRENMKKPMKWQDDGKHNITINLVVRDVRGADTEKGKSDAG